MFDMSFTGRPIIKHACFSSFPNNIVFLSHAKMILIKRLNYFFLAFALVFRLFFLTFFFFEPAALPEALSFLGPL